MDIAKKQANDFIALAGQDDQLWDNAIEKFNELYQQEYQKDPNASDSNNAPAFKLDHPNPLTKLTKDSMVTILENQGSISTQELNNMLNKEEQFLNLPS